MIKVYPERLINEPEYIGKSLPLENLRLIILREAKLKNLPVTVTIDEVKVGKGFASIGAPAEPCVVIYNANHRNSYYSYIISNKTINNRVYMAIYLGGESKNYRNQLASSHSSFFINEIIANRAKTKQIDEHIYYNEVKDIINKALSSPDLWDPVTTNNYNQNQDYNNQCKKQNSCSYDEDAKSTCKTTMPFDFSSFDSSEIDPQYDLTFNKIISATSAKNGGEVSIIFKHIDPDKIDFVYIPPGTKEGQIIRIPEKGLLNPATGRRGAFYLRVRVCDVYKWKKDFDIYYDNPLLRSSAINGTVLYVSLEHISADKIVKVTVPPGIKDKSYLRLKGCGDLNSSTGQRGDYYLYITIVDDI